MNLGQAFTLTFWGSALTYMFQRRPYLNVQRNKHTGVRIFLLTIFIQKLFVENYRSFEIAELSLNDNG